MWLVVNDRNLFLLIKYWKDLFGNKKEKFKFFVFSKMFCSVKKKLLFRNYYVYYDSFIFDVFK